MESMRAAPRPPGRRGAPAFLQKGTIPMENTEKVVYQDNAATTACDPDALAVMDEALSGACGNKRSQYSVGYEAKEFVV